MSQHYRAEREECECYSDFNANLQSAPGGVPPLNDENNTYCIVHAETIVLKLIS